MKSFFGQQNLTRHRDSQLLTDKQSPLLTVTSHGKSAHLTRVTQTLLEYFGQSSCLELGYSGVLGILSGDIYQGDIPLSFDSKKNQNYLSIFNCSHMKSRDQNCNGKFGKKNTQSDANIGGVCPSLPKRQVGVVVPLK